MCKEIRDKDEKLNGLLVCTFCWLAGASTGRQGVATAKTTRRSNQQHHPSTGFPRSQGVCTPGDILMPSTT
jgi:hypothetical protein